MVVTTMVANSICGWLSFGSDTYETSPPMLSAIVSTTMAVRLEIAKSVIFIAVLRVSYCVSR